jgi:hypothetical protein
MATVYAQGGDDMMMMLMITMITMIRGSTLAHAGQMLWF